MVLVALCRRILLISITHAPASTAIVTLPNGSTLLCRRRLPGPVSSSRRQPIFASRGKVSRQQQLKVTFFARFLGDSVESRRLLPSAPSTKRRATFKAGLRLLLSHSKAIFKLPRPPSKYFLLRTSFCGAREHSTFLLVLLSRRSFHSRVASKDHFTFARQANGNASAVSKQAHCHSIAS